MQYVNDRPVQKSFLRIVLVWLAAVVTSPSPAPAGKLPFHDTPTLIKRLSGVYAPKSKKGLADKDRHIKVGIETEDHNRGRLNIVVQPLNASDAGEGAEYHGRSDEIVPLGNGSGLILASLRNLHECDACFLFGTTKQGTPKMRMTLNLRDKPGTVMSRPDKVLFSFSKVFDQKYVRIADLELAPWSTE